MDPELQPCASCEFPSHQATSLCWLSSCMALRQSSNSLGHIVVNGTGTRINHIGLLILVSSLTSRVTLGNDYTSLCFCLLICKVGIIITPYGVV